MAPSNEYLLLLDHPAINIPITPTADIADTYSTPMLIFQIVKPLPKAIGAMAAKHIATTNIGAKLKSNLSAPSGVSPSFNKSFTVSAIACTVPQGPTLFGPNLICMNADTL